MQNFTKVSAAFFELSL